MNGRFVFFTWRELAVLLAVGAVTGVVDDNLEMLQIVALSHLGGASSLNAFLASASGGPLLGDLLETWLEYGGVTAACLVRKPASATIALTINGFCQVFVHGTHDPHLLYGAAGLGADLVFAAFRFRRYDLVSVALAGVACALFWYPVVWFTHGLYLYPTSFIASDLEVRVVGSALGDGLLGAGLALVVLRASGRRWDQPFGLGASGTVSAREVGRVAVPLLGAGTLLAALTAAISPVSRLLSEIGPRIGSGIPSMEEYNPGYMLGAALVLLAISFLVLWQIGRREQRPGVSRFAP